MLLALFTCCEKPHKLNSEVAEHNAAVNVALDVGEGSLKQALNFRMLGLVQKSGKPVGLKGHVRKPREQ